MSNDYADQPSPDYSDTLEESFQQHVSGIEQSDHSTAEHEESDGDSNIDDSVKEERAREMYEESHPDKEQQEQGGREIGLQEANWSVSSHRPHWGPEKLRDNNPLTYWQSDCPDAKKNHTIDLTFRQATIIKQVSIFIDFYQDESYTPKTIVIRAGNSSRDLVDVLTLECPQTVGWVNADISEAASELIRVFKLQIVILSTHLNGRDTHIRQVKVYSVLPKILDSDEYVKTKTNVDIGLR